MKNILQDISQYNYNLTISQVITLLERKGVTITRSMIQNYVRDGVLPAPINKRFYTHKHLAVLALIINLKSVYEICTIKTTLAPFMEKDGISLEVYNDYAQRSCNLKGMQDTKDTLLTMIYSVDLKNKVIERLSE